MDSLELKEGSYVSQCVQFVCDVTVLSLNMFSDVNFLMSRYAVSYVF